MSRRLSLVIGNTIYHDQRFAALNGPVADVSTLAEVLRSPTIGGFDKVDTLINASEASVRREIAMFLGGEKTRDDLLLLYFSGHGVRDERGDLYLAVADTDSRWLNATAVPASFISDALDRCRSRRLVLVLDCCHSGAFVRGAKAQWGGSVGVASAFEGNGSARVVLTATDATHYAWEGDQVTGGAQPSVFTKHLVEGLRTGQADADGDGHITVDELYDYVHDRVVDDTPTQEPCKFVYRQQGHLVVARAQLRQAEPRSQVEVTNAADSLRAGDLAKEGSVEESAGYHMKASGAETATEESKFQDSHRPRRRVESDVPQADSSDARVSTLDRQERADSSTSLRASQPRDRLATTAMILGFCSLLCLGLTGPIAVLVGVYSLNRIKASGGTVGGRERAQMGWILGVVSTGLGIIAVAVVVGVFWNSGSQVPAEYP